MHDFQRGRIGGNEFGRRVGSANNSGKSSLQKPVKFGLGSLALTCGLRPINAMPVAHRDVCRWPKRSSAKMRRRVYVEANGLSNVRQSHPAVDQFPRRPQLFGVLATPPPRGLLVARELRPRARMSNPKAWPDALAVACSCASMCVECPGAGDCVRPKASALLTSQTAIVAHVSWQGTLHGGQPSRGRHPPVTAFLSRDGV